MTPLTTILILLVTAAVSIVAFQRRDLWERLMFKPTEILRDKQFERMVTSGLVHLDWAHLGWNSLSFYLFGRNIEAVYGSVTLLTVYLASIIGGSSFRSSCIAMTLTIGRSVRRAVFAA